MSASPVSVLTSSEKKLLQLQDHDIYLDHTETWHCCITVHTFGNMTLVVNTSIALVHYQGMDNSDVLPAYTGSAPPNPLPNHALSAVHCTEVHCIVQDKVEIVELYYDSSSRLTLVCSHQHDALARTIPSLES